jgi:predicted Zn-ribbon and HTH transcriptional regulator
MLAAMKQNEGTGSIEWKKAGLGAVEVLFEEEKTIKECYLSALANLTDDDRRIIYQYYKGELERTVYRLAQRLRNRELMTIVAESQRDPDNMIMPSACKKCGFKEMRNITPIEKMMMDAFTKPYLECPRCGKPVTAKRDSTLKLVASLMG